MLDPNIIPEVAYVPAKLTLYPPQRAPRFVVIRDGETLVIGRDAQCGLVLEDPRVSKQHARLSWTGEGWVLENLGSKNGTTVNGRPPTGAELGHGDSIDFGGLSAYFERRDRRPGSGARLPSFGTDSRLPPTCGGGSAPTWSRRIFCSV